MKKKACQPSWTGEQLGCVWNLRPDISPQHLKHAVAYFALSQSDHGCIDGDDEDFVPGLLSPLHAFFSCRTSTGQIKLKPYRS